MIKSPALTGIVSAFIISMVFSGVFAQGVYVVPPASSFLLGPSTRAHALGFTGVSDIYDPANAYFNPAAISELDAYYLSGGYGKLIPDLADDVYTLNIGVAGGALVYTNASYNVNISGSIRYLLLDSGEWQVRDQYNQLIDTFNPKEHYLNITLSGCMTAAEIWHIGLGFSVKPLWSQGAETEYLGTSEYKKAAFDVGFLLRVDAVKKSGYLFTPSIGISYLNLGSDINTGGSNYPLPKMLRYGLGLRLETPSHPAWDEAMGRTLPIVTVMSAFDVSDERIENSTRENIYGFGTEAGLFQVLFLRYGYINNEDGNVKDHTFGVGVGLKYKRFEGRFDYSDYPQAGELDRVDKYGLIIGMRF